MSSLNSMARLESTLDCTPAVEVGPHASASLQSLASEDSDAALNATESMPAKKVADPVPSRFSPWLLSIAYPLGRFGLFPAYFGRVEVTGRENLPTSGPVILAPTHRSRWDAFLIPFAAGHHITGRHLRFMVSADEVTGLQGWFIRRMGGFPINTKRPAIASLRHGVELLEQGEVLVIFPEGNIFREQTVQPLKPGLARLAVQAEMNRADLGLKIVPIGVQYSDPLVPWRARAQVKIGPAIAVADYCTGHSKQDARSLTSVLQTALEDLVWPSVG